MDFNEGLDYPPPQNILNVFAAADLSSRSSSDSDKYKHAWIKAKVIRSSVCFRLLPTDVALENIFSFVHVG